MNLKILFVVFCISSTCFGQEEGSFKESTLDVTPFYGSILKHDPNLAHLIIDHPEGLILSYNKKTRGEKLWEADFNYPDLGYSFIYQNPKNEVLGKNYGVYAHYNFYFFNRNLQFRIGQGIALTTNPYDQDENFRNNAYGSDILSSTYLALNYYKERLFKGLGFKAGITLLHYSNANFRAPNLSTNTLAFNAGLIYTLGKDEPIVYLDPERKKIQEPIKYNLAFRTGLNESDEIGSGQFPFYIFSAYADKRLSNRSALQLGTDVFFSNFLKQLIRFQGTSFPELNVSGDEDFKRVGVFVGHELFINKLSVVTQLGYYVYYPFDFEGRVYNRVGLKRYFSDSIYGAVTLKSHGAAAEAVEFGIGIRL
ncbi:acyloxyacyl hydrolase [Spongiimicrobium salis]|uniref:acyloxyacyl hydrolase n=1 Tax=Spongiimicrobium salis TaxID=1667022 RepID=UPI00374D35B0